LWKIFQLITLAAYMANEPLQCKLAGKCGGCPSALRDFAPEAKSANVRKAFPSAEIRFAPSGRVRDRVDLIWENSQRKMRLGLYQMAPAPGEVPHIIDLEECPMMTEPLERWLKVFRQKAPPIAHKGSVRLRVSPSGERGVWLDFANVDVKTLFAEKSYLEWLSKEAFVEIGQRRKALTWREGQPKLVDPVLKPWFETYGARGEAIPLYGPVGGFSQAGFAANRALVGAVTELVTLSGETNWLELFAGQGNFALALAARGLQVEAFELDALAVAGLTKSAEERQLKIRVGTLDVYLQAKKIPEFKNRALLVDPPRAGLREVLAQMEHSELPRAIVYVSCFEESFLADSARLEALGFRAEAVLGVDQFPFSPHMEWVTLFSRK
jgi:23S rRNA (uracil1939-C5)-methyltransferase